MGEPNATPPSRTRLFLLVLLLVVVAGFGAKNLIERYFWKGGDTPERVVTPLQDHTARLSPALPEPAPVITSKRSETVPRAEKAASTSPKADSLPLAGEREPLSAPSPQTSGSGEPRTGGTALQGRFSVQVGAMAREANAWALKRRLERLGYPSVIRKGQASITQHVVLVVGSGDKSEADALMERLKLDGVSATVAESDGGYRVEAGRSTLLDEAIDLARDLQKKGFTTKIASETAITALYRVRVGESTSRNEARRIARELRGKGFPVFIVRR